MRKMMKLLDGIKDGRGPERENNVEDITNLFTLHEERQRPPPFRVHKMLHMQNSHIPFTILSSHFHILMRKSE